jgi:predicted Zn-dependent peptidase
LPGRAVLPAAARERFACYVLNTLLGGGMSSRLFQNISERQGLAYAVFSELSPYRDTGCLSIYAGTSIESAPQGGGIDSARVPRSKQEPVARRSCGGPRIT